MITKFKSIRNLAVFKNFTWNNSLRDSGNNVILFKPINILYGRNYSGKTTLSRIVRALETGFISNKYQNPEFEVSFEDVVDATSIKLTSHGKKIRVFNEDFVRENLKFITNSDDSIAPFAILGGNAAIEEDIKLLKTTLGINEEGKESGYYLELKNTILAATKSLQDYQRENNGLEQKLSEKATDRTHGIKYKPERFGDQNYTIRKLETDISAVLDPRYLSIADDEVSKYLKLLDEKPSATTITACLKPAIHLDFFSSQAKILITKSVGDSDKIEQLLRDSVLNRWVKEGRSLHKDKLENCAFCNSSISSERWESLDKHFDEESDKLENEIDDLLKRIDVLVRNLDTEVSINKGLFYSKFHPNLDRLSLLKQKTTTSLKLKLNQIRDSLLGRKNDILNPKPFEEIVDTSKRLDWIWMIYENIRIKANSYTNEINTEQNEARKILRLHEVSNFISTIRYVSEKSKIEKLNKISDLDAKKKIEMDSKIKKQIELIQEKERLMNDEEKGALKVNEYLNNFFGHDFLTLQALEEIDQLGGKKIRFEIIRDGKKAHHLSEGECSLIAFCYFMAKLEDIETKGSKPIIWIDDPISSLDSNHIFFVYSLINSEIVFNQNFSQLFISTHNLDFLRYLKNLPRASNKRQFEYFLVFRENQNSLLKQMPSYLKDYITEFNFLFHQIYLCANANANDENHHKLFYNFGNNARKFLEAFLFYKYPNAVDKDDKLTKFFDGNKQASSMADRINNELSHLEGLFERSMVPIDVVEMKKVASFVLKKIEEKDKEQFEALLKSIGVEKEIV